MTHPTDEELEAMAELLDRNGPSHVDADIWMSDAAAMLRACKTGDAPYVEWQPIRTAHKSERLLVCYMDSGGLWEVGIGLWWLGDEWTVSCEEGTVKPTHWMPLPAPPDLKKGPSHD
jgi:hypothetical protein